MLGFAMRAGKVIIGTESVLAAVAKQGKAKPKIVLISSTASDGTRKKILTKCEFYHIQAAPISLSSDELGSLLGKLYAPAVVAITDDGFATQIRLALGISANGEGEN